LAHAPEVGHAQASDTSHSPAHTQWEVENHFITVTAAINTLSTNHYWMGMQLAGSTWYLLDGTVLGNGAPSNANPYAHM
jgi:hypothetical protein